MKSFYSGLKEQVESSEALRTAKLNYLENSDALSAHPFFLAPFVLIGTSEVIETTDSSIGLPSFLVLASKIIIVLIAVRNLKRKESKQVG